MLGIGVNLTSQARALVPPWLPSGAVFHTNFRDQNYLNGTVYSDLNSLMASSDGSFDRASAGLYLSSDGSYVSFDGGEARVDDRGLLIEPASTNLIAESAVPDQAPWNFTRLAENEGSISPLGVESTRLRRTSTTQTAYTQQLFSPKIAIGEDYCLSAIVSAATTGNRLALRVQSTYPDRSDAVFDLVGGTVVGTGATSHTDVTASITPLSQGYYLCQIKGTAGGTDIAQVLLGPTDSSRSVVFWEVASNILSDVDIAHIQFETGVSACTSPIITSQVHVTRAADVLTLFPDAGVYNITATFDDDSTQTILNQTITETGWQIPTNLDRQYIKSLTGRRV